jgi:hypothetical protein
MLTLLDPSSVAAPDYHIAIIMKHPQLLSSPAIAAANITSPHRQADGQTDKQAHQRQANNQQQHSTSCMSILHPT